MIYPFDDDSLNDALQFAVAAHDGQLRKYTDNLPYIIHPIGVAKIVMTVTDDPEMIKSALLHDAAEDCDVTLIKIGSRFGERVAALVDDLTDKTIPADGYREQRRKMDRERIAQIHPDAKTIKRADIIHNTGTIDAAPKSYADLYMAEKHEFLKMLTEGHPALYAKANQIIKQYLAAQFESV